MSYVSYAFRVSTASYWDFVNQIVSALTTAGWSQADMFGQAYGNSTATLTGLPSNGNTVTLDTKVYTFTSAAPSSEGQVLIGASTSATLQNLKDAINHTNVGGGTYVCAAAHPTCNATTLTGGATSTLVVQYNTYNGYLANLCATTKSGGTVFTWTGSTLSGGASPTYVYSSNGESGLEPTGYIWITYDSVNNQLTLKAYQYWNAGAHTGTRQAAASFSGNNLGHSTLTSSGDCIIACDKNILFFSCAWLAAEYNDCLAIGHIPVRLHTALTTTTAQITSGSPVNIPVASSAGFIIGQKIQIVGLSEGCDLTQVTAIPDISHITVASVIRTYASGAFLGLPASTFGVYYPTNAYRWLPCSFISDAGLTVSTPISSAGGANAYDLVPLFQSTAGVGTQAQDQKQLASPIMCLLDGTTDVGMTDTRFMYTAATTFGDGALQNADGSIPTAYAVTAYDGTHLSQASVTWTPGALVGKWVVVVTGNGAGQARIITANTATQVTVSPAFYSTAPDTTSGIKICDYFWRLLPYVFSTGTYTAIQITNTVNIP